MKKLILGLIVIVVLAVLYYTNPTIEQHRDAMKRVAVVIVNEKTDSILNAHPTPYTALIKNFRNKNIDVVADKFADQFITRKNYYFFSLTEGHYQGRNHYLGLGIFNKVYIPNQVVQYVRENVNFNDIKSFEK